MSDVLYRVKKVQSGRVIVNNLPESIINTINSNLPCDGVKKISVSGQDAKILKKSARGFELIAFTKNPDYIKSSRLIKTEAEILLAASENIEKEIYAARDRADSQAKRLIHNLKSLTAKTQQEIYYILMQDRLMSSQKDLMRYAEQQIIDNSKDVAKALLIILKYAKSQNVEYSGFQKLNGDVGSISKESHQIHKVLMNIFYIFFQDFTDNEVVVNLEKNESMGFFDYDSIHVCLYHLIENAAKYIKSGSDFHVYIVNDTETQIIFEMDSLLVDRNEEDLIFKDNYSGRLASNKSLSGTGIGLCLARQMALLNGGNLTFIRGNPLFQNSEYARNKFILSLPLV